MKASDALTLAADWATVCDAAGVDTDATAEEVIYGFAINHAALSAALSAIYDHGTQPNAHREAREIIRRLAVRDDY